MLLDQRNVLTLPITTCYYISQFQGSLIAGQVWHDIVDSSISDQCMDYNKTSKDDLKEESHVRGKVILLFKGRLTKLFGSFSLPAIARQMSCREPSWLNELAMIGSMYFGLGAPGFGFVACFMSFS